MGSKKMGKQMEVGKEAAQDRRVHVPLRVVPSPAGLPSKRGPGLGSFSRALEWVAIPFSRGSSQPRDRTQVSCIAGGFFTN